VAGAMPGWRVLEPAAQPGPEHFTRDEFSATRLAPHFPCVSFWSFPLRHFKFFVPKVAVDGLMVQVVKGGFGYWGYSGSFPTLTLVWFEWLRFFFGCPSPRMLF